LSAKAASEATAPGTLDTAILAQAAALGQGIAHASACTNIVIATTILSSVSIKGSLGTNLILKTNLTSMVIGAGDLTSDILLAAIPYGRWDALGSTRSPQMLAAQLRTASLKANPRTMFIAATA
jgi:hypothetical protein